MNMDYMFYRAVVMFVYSLKLEDFEDVITDAEFVKP